MDVRKTYFLDRVIGHCNRLPRALVTALRLPEFKKHLDNALRHMD